MLPKGMRRRSSVSMRSIGVRVKTSAMASASRMRVIWPGAREGVTRIGASLPGKVQLASSPTGARLSAQAEASEAATETARSKMSP